MKYALRFPAWRALDDKASSCKRQLLSNAYWTKKLTSFEASQKESNEYFLFGFPLCSFLNRHVLRLFHIFGLRFLKPNKSPCQDAFRVILKLCKRCTKAEFLHHSTTTPETVITCLYTFHGCCTYFLELPAGHVWWTSLFLLPTIRFPVSFC